MTREQLAYLLLLTDVKWKNIKGVVTKYYNDGYALPDEMSWLTGCSRETWDDHRAYVERVRVEKADGLKEMRSRIRARQAKAKNRDYMREYMRKRRAAQKEQASGQSV